MILDASCDPCEVEEILYEPINVTVPSHIVIEDGSPANIKIPTHIVVGCGASGAVLCDRLSKFANIILIEKGSRGHNFKYTNSKNPIKWAECAYVDGEATRYLTQPQRHLFNRIIKYPQGNGIGGSFNINAAMWTAGHPSVFDKYWPKEWNSTIMKRLIISSSDIFKTTLIQSTGHMKRLLNSYKKSTSPPFSISTSTKNDPKYIPNININTHHNYIKNDYIWSKSIQDSHLAALTTSGERTDIAALIQSNPLINIICNSEVLCIEFDSTKTDNYSNNSKNAINVVIRGKNGHIMKIQPENGGEIILCAGAIETPRILLASGFHTQTESGTQSQSQSHYPSQHQSKTTTNINNIYNNNNNNLHKIHESNNSSTSNIHILRPDLGHTLQDHVILPVMMLGNWWNDKPIHTSTSNSIWEHMLSFPMAHMVLCIWRVLIGVETPQPSIPSSMKLNNNGCGIGSGIGSESYMCGNGVHGWMLLDENGDLIDEEYEKKKEDSDKNKDNEDSSDSDSSGSSGSTPLIQLVLVDGRMLPGMLADLSLPDISPHENMSRWQIYLLFVYTIIRTFLFILLQWLTSLDIVTRLLSCFFGFLVCVVRPESRGHISIDEERSHVLNIDPCYLKDKRDSNALLIGIKAVRKLIQNSQNVRNTPSPSPPPPSPSANTNSNSNSNSNYYNKHTHTQLQCIEILPGLCPLPWYIKLFSAPYFHCCGSCPMVPFDALPEAGIVTPDLRVIGVNGLRIADASVIPMIPSGPIHAVCSAIGEAAAELLIYGKINTNEDICMM
eukprot:gene4216-8390_t